MAHRDEVELGATQRALDWFEYALIYRWPHVAGPLALAGGALGLAAATHYAAGRWPWAGWGPWIVSVLVSVVVGLGIESVFSLPGRRERGYAYVLWLGGGAWTVVAAWLGPWWGPTWLGLGPLMWAWGGLLAVGWPPWFKHRRVRRAVEVSAEILAWDGDAVGLPRVELASSGAGADGHSWWARLVPQRKGEYTLAKLRQAIPRIAARYDVAQGDVSVEAVRDGREGEYLLRIQTAPREEQGARFEVPEKRPSARRPFEIGHQQGGAPILSELWREGHGGVDGLAAGQKGYGKTNYGKRAALQAIAAHDALNIIADLKPGSPDYQRIGPYSWLYATTPAQVDLVIRVLLVICEARGARLRKDRKVLLFQLDESALYFNPTAPELPPADLDPTARRRWISDEKRRAEETDTQRAANYDNLLAISRSYDLGVRVQTQRGTERRIGGAAARSALLAGEVFGVYSPRDADAALLSDDGEFDLASLPRDRKGEALISNGQHHDPTRGTIHYVTEDAEAEVLDRYGPDQGDLMEDELRAIRERIGPGFDELRAANRVVPVPDPSEAPTGPDEEPEEAPRRLTREESLDVVWSALAGLDRPALARDVAEACGKSERMVRIRLDELVTAGRAERRGGERWGKFTAVG